jgi:hypothetical protein
VKGLAPQVAIAALFLNVPQASVLRCHRCLPRRGGEGSA